MEKTCKITKKSVIRCNRDCKNATQDQSVTLVKRRPIFMNNVEYVRDSFSPINQFGNITW